MPGHVFLVDSLADAVPGGEVALAGPEGRHAATVLRVRAGESVDVVDGHGRRARGVISHTGKDSASVTVAEVVDEPPPDPRIIVVQALAKGDRGERAVETLTEVGVDEIVPWSAERSVSRWRDEKADRGLEKWRTAARAAAKQARRARIPDVHALASTQDLEDLVRSAELALVLDEEAVQPIGSVTIPSTGSVVLVVGPEGGMTDAERRGFESWGARLVRLGPSVLRTSTAGTVAAGIMLAPTARWRSDRS